MAKTKFETLSPALQAALRRELPEGATVYVPKTSSNEKQEFRDGVWQAFLFYQQGEGLPYGRAVEAVAVLKSISARTVRRIVSAYVGPTF